MKFSIKHIFERCDIGAVRIKRFPRPHQVVALYYFVGCQPTLHRCSVYTMMIAILQFANPLNISIWNSFCFIHEYVITLNLLSYYDKINPKTQNYVNCSSRSWVVNRVTNANQFSKMCDIFICINMKLIIQYQIKKLSGCTMGETEYKSTIFFDKIRRKTVTRKITLLSQNKRLIFCITIIPLFLCQLLFCL